MVNLVEAVKSLQNFLAKRAGLRQHEVEIEPGTLINFWIPKEKVPKKEGIIEEVVVLREKSDIKASKEKSIKNSKEKPAVVLVHGFTADGIMTWQFHIRKLARHYAVCKITDLIFFGGSTSTSTDRSPGFQARCFLTALERFGVEACTVVGFSYGGVVAFKMAEAKPNMVRNLVVSGSVTAITDSMATDILKRLGCASLAQMLLPESVNGIKALFSMGAYKKVWLPDRFHKDYLKVMFSNRKERVEMLEGLVIRNKDEKVSTLTQRILLLWGENDGIFNIELAKNMKEQLGENTTLQTIKKAGHLAHLERPCVYNRCLKEFLAHVHNEPSQK